MIQQSNKYNLLPACEISQQGILFFNSPNFIIVEKLLWPKEPIGLIYSQEHPGKNF
jgi:hypothetical protein